MLRRGAAEKYKIGESFEMQLPRRGSGSATERGSARCRPGSKTSSSTSVKRQQATDADEMRYDPRMKVRAQKRIRMYGIEAERLHLTDRTLLEEKSVQSPAQRNYEMALDRFNRSITPFRRRIG